MRSIAIGRPLNELMTIYSNYKANSKVYIKLQENVSVSSNIHLSLKEYCWVCEEYCLQRHDQQKCTECRGMVKAANLIHFGFYPLSCVFRSCFPGVTYSSATAKCKLLKMPLAAITLGSPSSGTSEVYLMEAVQGVDYLKLIEFLESKMSKGMMPGLTKQQVKDLLCFAQSDRERETLRYTVCHASGLTSSGA